jgi:ketosteroid isomerase-like protein
MQEQVDTAAVLEANAAFYRAFSAMDLDQMSALWTRDDSISCVHPGWPLLTGREPVIDSWACIFDNAAVMQFDIVDVEVTLEADFAWVVCTERLTSVQGGQVAEGRVQTTNLFRKEAGQWLVVHHHGSPLMTRG